jgi:hypothetical protein
MQNAADRISVQSGNRDNSHSSIISNLDSLVEQVRASMKLIESAIAEASPVHQDATSNIVVLDDVTPHYVRANAALSTCNAGLGVALHLLQDIRTSKQEPEGAEDEPVDLTRCA